MGALGRAGQWFYRTSDADLGLSKQERIVKDSFGCLMGGFIFGLQGRIVLTNRRLIFVSQSARVLGPDQVWFDIPLATIEDAKAGSVWDGKALFSPFLPFVITAAGENYQFQSVDASELVALIKAALPAR